LLAERKESIQKNPQRWLDKIHKTPAWFSANQSKVAAMFHAKGTREYVKGGKKRIVKTRALTFTQFDREIRLKDPVRTARAEKIMFEYFSARAERTIQRYFQARPESPYSFDQIYQQMLIRQWAPFLQSVKRLGLRQATWGLEKALSMRPNEESIHQFELAFIRKRDLVGMFQTGTGEYEKEDNRVHADNYNEHELKTSAELDRLPAKHFSNKEFENYLSIPRLNPREREILRMRYEHDMTLEETGRELKVTRERVRQIETRALSKIRQKEKIGNPKRKKGGFGSRGLRAEIIKFLNMDVGRLITIGELATLYHAGLPPKGRKRNNYLAHEIRALMQSNRLQIVDRGVYRILPPE
jgi:RNA polymerase sigma factor (sigma-70 family)